MIRTRLFAPLFLVALFALTLPAFAGRLDNQAMARPAVRLSAPAPMVASGPAAVQADPTYQVIISDTWVLDPLHNVHLYARVVEPDPALYPGQQFPAVVTVPGGTGAGAPMAAMYDYQSLAQRGFVVIAWNAPGRGNGQPGNLISEGTEDCNGFAGQDALKAVIERTLLLPNVNTSNLGLQTASYGITMGAGTVGRYPALPIRYLVDMEGPSNSLITTFYYGHELPVCGHYSLATDPSPENEAWWSEREAYRYIGNFDGYYLRAQATTDHAQPPGVYTHTLEMNNVAVAGGVPWVRVDGPEMGNPISVAYSPTLPLWLPGRLADYTSLTSNYIAEMAARFGAVITPTWQVAVRLPHDVDRLENGHTLITLGDTQQGRMIEVDGDDQIVGMYVGALSFAHNADRLSNGYTLLSDTGHDRVIELDEENRTVWSSEWISLSDGSTLNYPNDVETVVSDHLLITDRDNHRVLEIDRAGAVLWQFGQTGVPGGDDAHLNGPHNADRLANGNTILADSNNNRILEIDPSGAIVWRYEPTGLDALDWPRDADRLANGNTLIVDSNHGRIVEVDQAGIVVWQYTGLTSPYDADRLANGHTLIANSGADRVIEVDAAGRIVWRFPHSALDYQDSAFGVYSSHTLHTYFMNQMGMDEGSYYEWCDSHLANLGSHWTRFSLIFFWQLIDPQMNGNYRWNIEPCFSDSLLRAVYEPPNQVNVMAVITPLGPDGRTPLNHTAEYTAFVTALAERYDGDGVGDLDPNIHLNYFQLANELQDWFNYGMTAAQYAQSAQITLNALRAANPDAQLFLLGQTGAGNGLDPDLQAAVEACAALGVDIAGVDIHYWDSSDQWRPVVLTETRALLDSLGLTEAEIWSAENATYVGCPQGFGGEPLPVLSEVDQARSLAKRITWGRAHGLDRILWSELVDWYMFNNNPTNPWNAMGLIGDGALVCDPTQVGHERVSYWTYQLLSRYTDVFTATQVGEMNLTGGDLYGYEYNRLDDGRPLYILWDETGRISVTLPVSATVAHVINLITDNEGNAQEYDLEAPDGRLRMSVGQDPLLVLIGCQGPEQVLVDGPVMLRSGEEGMYSASVLPITTSLPLTLTWDNGAIGSTAAYSWTAPGGHTIVVTAENDCGSITGTMVVTVCQPVEQAAPSGPLFLAAGQTGLYSATYTPLTATQPITLSWDNGTVGATAAYSWTQPGSYTVTVTATNECGTAVGALMVEVAAGCIPVEETLIAGPTFLSVGQEGQYTAESLPVTATQPVTFSWNNGATGGTAVYSWTVPGNYTVTVVAENECGTATGTRAVQVTAGCVPVEEVLVAGPLALRPGEEGLYSATYTPITASQPITLSWNNGATGPTAAYSWTVPGTYTVTVTATGPCGEPVTGSAVVQVSAFQIYLPVVVKGS